MMRDEPALEMYRAERDALQQCIVAALQTDERVVAAWLAGSIGRGTTDALSDLDLWIVLHDDAMQAVCERPRDFVTAIRAPLLIIEQPANAPSGGAYLFTLFAGETGPHEIDWYWLPASTAARPSATRLLFDHAGGIPVAAGPPALSKEAARERLSLLLDNVIAMMVIGGKLIARGWTLPAARNLDMVHQLLAEIEWITERNTLPAFDDIKGQVGGTPVPASSAAGLSALARLLDRAETLRPQLAASGVTWPAAAVAEARTYLSFVRKATSRDHSDLH